VVAALQDDIRQREQTEHALQAALADREMLLREVHHRTRNNLQMLGDLLEIEAQTLASPEKRAILEKSRRRIHAFARLHDELYPALENGRVRLRRYLAHLLEGVGQLHPGLAVRLEAAGDDIALDPDRTVRVGLVVMELVSNAAIHAFPWSAHRPVTVRLIAQGRTCQLQVVDRGIGLPREVDPTSAASLGFRLIRLVSLSLGATISVNTLGGTAFTLRFPVPDG
jgi:two-component sensor histidine kinase